MPDFRREDSQNSRENKIFGIFLVRPWCRYGLFCGLRCVIVVRLSGVPVQTFLRRAGGAAAAVPRSAVRDCLRRQAVPDLCVRIRFCS